MVSSCNHCTLYGTGRVTSPIFLPLCGFSFSDFTVG
nr:MAG TPA: hypothetical protein [Bacteriophage sp.]